MRLRESNEVTSPVLRIVLDRAAAGSRPGGREDAAIVALAIEGGGMRGAVSAGMGVVLEAAGLVSAFDRVYGVSAGALNAWALAAGQAALGATHYQDAACRKIINRVRPLLGRPVVDLDALFGELIGARKPLQMPRQDAPDLRVLAASLDAAELRVLHQFGDKAQVLHAVRVSAALPRLAGRPPLWRGERMVDGGMIEPIPYQTALGQGATHVLVLRSRPSGYRKARHQALGEELLLRDDPALVGLARDRRDVYNGQASALAAMDADAPVLQITVPNDSRLIGRLETNPARIADVLALGAKAMADAVAAEPVALCWQPTLYHPGPVAAPAPLVSTSRSRTPRVARLRRTPARA